MKKNIFTRIIAIALVAMSIMAIATTALADYRPWQYRWNAHTILPGTYPADGTTLNTQIRNLQEDINTFRSNVAVFHTTGSGYYFAALTVDGKYGNTSANAVKMIQKYFGLTQDGKCGENTKNALWNALGYNPPAT